MTSIEMAVMAADIKRVTEYNVSTVDIENAAEDMKHTMLGLEFTKFFPGEDDKDYLRVKEEFPAMAADVIIMLLTMARRHDISVNEIFEEFNKTLKRR